MVGTYDSANDILPSPVNSTPPTRTILFYAASARCKAGAGNCLRHEKCGIFVEVRSRQMLLLPEFLAEWADFNTQLHYDNVCLKGPHE